MYKETRELFQSVSIELFHSVYAQAVSLAIEIKGREMVTNLWIADKLE